jgi:protein-disulfide isomerase
VKPQLVEQYVQTGRVKFVWHDLAWIGDESRQAAQAARCAGRQGQFWAYHDLLYANQRGFNNGTFAVPRLQEFGQLLGLEPTSFNACLDQREDLPAIQQDLAAARAAGHTATPVFLLNGKRLAAGTVAQFGQAIEAELARVGG